MTKSASVPTASGKNFRIAPKVVRESIGFSTQIASTEASAKEACALPDKKMEPSFPNRINDYMERFICNNTYAAPQVKYIATEINPEIEWKIRQILFCRKKGRVCSLKAFINNVLAAHLEEYADVINQLKL
ncbi:DUF3408 domain-containing protein [uncultured Duncaniella sp.]|uniref:DUF3408 domain-containing protein n=1 Tax=uncultured Duncaniella sp. TaxID=2768039 RepID=UPI0025FF8BBB|nr:DUF3408 domain-containing protein [uncultured Duncaniella sp.]